MKNLRNKVERFFFRNRYKGIPNLMLWIISANALALILCNMDPSGTLYSLLYFDRSLIFQGQVWRLFSFVFLDLSSAGLFWAFIRAVVYYQFGQALENVWGVCRFNFYYLTGWLMSVIGGLLFGYTSISYLHLSLFMAYATLYPDTQFRILFIIPVKARWLGILDLVLYLIQLLNFALFPINLLPLFGLANYFLYFGKDIVNIFPDSWRINARGLFRRKGKAAKGSTSGKAIPFRSTGSYEGDHGAPRAPYTHKCTICGRTDASHPGLEFRYCSRCKGYHCYCIDHINDHTHVE